MSSPVKPTNNPSPTPAKQPTFYLVGGAVRDQLLGLPVTDRDWVVVGATPKWMHSQGFKPVGADFPVFIHPKTGEEYALARTERKTGRGYQGFTFFCAPNVTLDEDLQRRDLTINALAQTTDGKLIDTVGGHADLKAKLLRHVSDAFIEDPLRVLRVARFYARFQPLGFSIAPETLELMRHITRSGELEALTQERVFQELLKALETQAPHCFFEALTNINALPTLMPALATHFADPHTQALAFAALSAAVSSHQSTAVRFACLSHSLAENGALETFCQDLKAPKDFLALARITHQLVVFSQQVALAPQPSTVLELLESVDAYRRPERFDTALDALNCQLKSLPNSDTLMKAPIELLKKAHAATMSITGRSIIQSATAKDEAPPSGQAMGAAITKARLQAIQTLLSEGLTTR